MKGHALNTKAITMTKEAIEKSLVSHDRTKVDKVRSG
jgi:hypothetical protein